MDEVSLRDLLEVVDEEYQPPADVYEVTPSLARGLSEMFYPFQESCPKTVEAVGGVWVLRDMEYQFHRLRQRTGRRAKNERP